MVADNPQYDKTLREIYMSDATELCICFPVEGVDVELLRDVLITSHAVEFYTDRYDIMWVLCAALAHEDCTITTLSLNGPVSAKLVGALADAFRANTRIRRVEFGTKTFFSHLRGAH